MLLDSATFVQSVRQLRLLDARQADEFARFAQGQAPDARALAKDLLGRGWLTPFQANQLLQGRGGSLLLGSYVLLERLGEGGMGAVFKGANWKIGRVVALKLIRKECLTNESIVRRFHQEIEAAAQLSHPNIIHAFDAGEADGTHFFVMELVEGTDLSKLVKQNGPLPVRQTCDYMRQAALGLQHAHERGMVHRDIKPSNLLLNAEGVVKVLDMGLARLTGVTVEGEMTNRLTQEGAVMGTPDYIAPEQTLDAHSADIRADLYSLGCTFYHLLTGRVPFPGGTLGQKIAKHLSREPDPLRGLRPDAPERVAGVVSRLMAKRPEDRYQTPGELALELTRILSERPTSETTASPTAATVSLANPFDLSLSRNPRCPSHDNDGGDSHEPETTRSLGHRRCTRAWRPHPHRRVAPALAAQTGHPYGVYRTDQAHRRDQVCAHIRLDRGAGLGHGGQQLRGSRARRVHRHDRGQEVRRPGDCRGERAVRSLPSRGRIAGRWLGSANPHSGRCLEGGDQPPVPKR